MSKIQEIIGRIHEQEALKKTFNSQQAEFIAIYGRRRVGKTFLVRQFFTSHKHIIKEAPIFLYVTGTKNGSLQDQISNFTQELGKAFYAGAPIETKETWRDSLQTLSLAIQNVPPHKKIILFFDEFPWLVTPNSNLLQTLEYYWNHHWSRDPRIKLIICGSSAGWILKHIVNNKGGLYNRVTKAIHLQPFNLYETAAYLKSRKIQLNEHQIVHLYMVLGGIPFYLSQIEPGLSAAQNVERLAFKNNGFLIREFSNLYATLFEESQTHIELTRTISKHPYGIGQEELIKSIPHISSGGRITQWLSDLENAGFIIRLKPFLNKKKGIFYKLIDEYSLFYFRWIEPIKDSLLEQGMRSSYWKNLQNTPAWNSWIGYAFESLCYKHIPQISKGLDLSPTAVPYTWRYAPSKKIQEQTEKTDESRGAQIDLLFDRDDDSITICEIKYTSAPYTIDKKSADQLKQRLKVFKTVTRTKKHLFLSIISANGLKESIYSTEYVSSSIDLTALFHKLPTD
ncbi:MAG: AAA family ATPase [Alphaproteobacteria bacterium]|jgi:AAA+ ATPase superfamily predicted ATPase|nr:AAA family ATPase [Alphaproteobacteria bacterium]MBP9878008.1 AAA family ATPase [Alphaproteobacteria bacterium]